MKSVIINLIWFRCSFYVDTRLSTACVIIIIIMMLVKNRSSRDYKDNVRTDLARRADSHITSCADAHCSHGSGACCLLCVSWWRAYISWSVYHRRRCYFIGLVYHGILASQSLIDGLFSQDTRFNDDHDDHDDVMYNTILSLYGWDEADIVLIERDRNICWW